MATHSKKRKLDGAPSESQPPIKRHRKCQSKGEGQIISVKFQNESRKYKKEELDLFEFCKAKLKRWSPNIDTDDEDDNDLVEDTQHNKKQQCFIDFSLFPCITPPIFTAIIHLQQILTKSDQTETDDYKAAATTLLSDNITINDLPQLFESCKILLIKKVFNHEIFKYYFDGHLPISFETYQQFIETHKNDQFIKTIISRQISMFNILNQYSVQRKVYEHYNKMKNRNCLPFSGNAVSISQPNGENAMRYLFDQIKYELWEREPMRHALANYQKYGDSRYDWNVDDDNVRVGLEKELLPDLDYGLCGAFDDMIQCKTDIRQFVHFFIDEMSAIDLEADVDRSHFSFYGLAYIAHNIFMLYLQNNESVVIYISNISKCLQFVEHLFDKILKCGMKYDGIKDRMMILMQQRINDGIKWKNEWNNAYNAIYYRCRPQSFPECVFELSRAVISDPKWLIDNFAMKCKNSDCRKVMQYIFDFCLERMDEANVSESVNTLFQRWLGVRLRNNNN